jgi:hypothetical protein
VPRTFLVGLGVLVFTALLVAGGAVAINPTLLTGPWYEFTVTDALIDPDGTVHLGYTDRLSYGAEVAWYDAPAMKDTADEILSDDSWSRRKGGFLRWPRSSEGTRFSLTIRLPEKGPGRGTLLIHKGETYRLRAGEKLIYYRDLRKDGILEESVVEARAE